MAYSDFTLDVIQSKFGVNNQVQGLFVPKPADCAPSQTLVDALKTAQNLRLRTEKAKSEWVVVPIISEVLRLSKGFLTVYSGENLDVDKKNGLRGECDFIISKETNTYNISLPILAILEAKNHDIDLGIAQCGAQLIGAKLFNEQKKNQLNQLYGCVTTGEAWRFLMLKDNTIIIDKNIYTLKEINQLLGIFVGMIDYYKTVLQ